MSTKIVLDGVPTLTATGLELRTDVVPTGDGIPKTMVTGSVPDGMIVRNAAEMLPGMNVCTVVRGRGL